MLELSVKKRDAEQKTQELREKGVIPAVLYGDNVKNTSLGVDLKTFLKVYKEAGKSSLISLLLDDKKIIVLVHDIALDPLTLDPIHVDFYQPNLKEEVEAIVALVFEGESKGVKDFGGTLVKNIREVEVKALPQNLPHEIIVNIDCLENINDNILIKDLLLPDGVTITKDPNESVIFVADKKQTEEIPAGKPEAVVEVKEENVGEAEKEESKK